MKPLLFCRLRKKEVKATPEEIVRQGVIKWLLEEGGYPPGLIAIEYSLPVPKSSKLKRRADLLVFLPADFPSFKPLLLIECKAAALTEESVRQLIGYNVYLKAPFIALASPQGMFSVSSDRLAAGLPLFEEAARLNQ